MPNDDVTDADPSSTTLPPTTTAQSYPLIHKERLSPDSFLLRYQIPPNRPHLGTDPWLPTCIKVNFPHGQDAHTGTPKTLSKSYSPVSHPNTVGTFDLIVKGYPPRAGGGVGQYLCDMEPDSSITAELKSPRIMHGSPSILNRGWTHVGLVAGGTGIAPLLQIARILLESAASDGGAEPNGHANEDPPADVVVHLLFVNRHEADILGRTEIEALAARHPGRFRISYALTGDEGDEESKVSFEDPELYNNNDEDTATATSPRFFRGRGTVATARASLPPPDRKVMIFVCGKDGFVAHWAGPVARGPPKEGKKKGPKIQGPLLGVLAEAGYTADQVFKY